jgi:hypothetical protein
VAANVAPKEIVGYVALAGLPENILDGAANIGGGID